MTKIYIAGPFFNSKERVLLEEMISEVKKKYAFLGDEVSYYIPMENFIEGGMEMPNHLWGAKVFCMDCNAINNCDLVIAMYMGMYSDTGTAWEIGYAYGKNIPCVLYIPKEYRDKDMNIMPINGCEGITTFGEDYSLETLVQK